MTDTARQETQPAGGPALLPWTLVGVLFGAICAAALIAAYGFGPVYAPAAVAGIGLGFFGAVFGDVRKVWFGVLAVALATVLSALVPEWVRLVVIIPVMAGLAGRELAVSGTRVFVFAIISWILLLAPALGQGADGTLIGVFGVAVGGGAALAVWLGAQGRVAPVAVERGYAAAHSCALAIGLALALVIATQFDGAQTHWIAMLFAVRALDPPGQHLQRTFRAGAATIAGAGAAGLLVLLPLAPVIFKVLGVALMLVGMRYLPSGMARSSAMMSAGVVLATAPDTQTALFRIEAAAIAAALVVGVFVLVAYVRTAFFRAPAGGSGE